MEKLKFKIALESEWFNHPPNLRISINHDTIIDGPVREPTIIEREIPLEDEQSHTLNFTLHDKSNHDTHINESGEITKDTLIKIKQIEIDDVDITHLLPINHDTFYYKHDTGTLEPFYDTLGVNGTATVKFTTPFYQWLLENL